VKNSFHHFDCAIIICDDTDIQGRRWGLFGVGH